MTERHLTVTVGEKVQERPVPHVRLRQGKYGMKLDIVRDGSFLQRAAQALNPVELHPLGIDKVFLFASCAVGFWSGNYAIFMRVYHEHSFGPETIGRITTTYVFFGIDGTACPVPLGVAKSPVEVVAYLGFAHGWNRKLEWENSPKSHTALVLGRLFSPASILEFFQYSLLPGKVFVVQLC